MCEKAYIDRIKNELDYLDAWVKKNRDSANRYIYYAVSDRMIRDHKVINWLESRK
jgi:hypothetical protein